MTKTDHVGPDRRRYARLNEEDLLICEPLSVETTESESGEKFYAFTKSLGGGGILFESDTFFEIGTILKLQIDIPGWEKFETASGQNGASSGRKPFIGLGKVVRVQDIGGRRFEIGVAFMAVDDGQRLVLQQYLEKARKNRGS